MVPGAFYKTPIIRESNAISVLHRLIGEKLWDALLENPGTLAADVFLGLGGPAQCVRTLIIVEGVPTVLIISVQLFALPNC